MEAKQDMRPAATLSPVDERTLTGLTLADGFHDYCDGDPSRLSALLFDAARDPQTHLAIALSSGAHICGFMCSRAPGPDSRLYTVVPAIELTAFEVARGDRHRGVFTALFGSMFRRQLEESIIFVVADPALKEEGESARTFRERLEAVLGSVGFVPMPTDDPGLHPHRDSTLFARVGRGVPGYDIEYFHKRLRSSSYATVAIAMKAPLLRNLLRTDLERNGFWVHSVSTRGTNDPVDILITEGGGRAGRLLTVRLNGGCELQWQDGTIWYPETQVDGLAGVLLTELEKRGSIHV